MGAAVAVHLPLRLRGGLLGPLDAGDLVVMVGLGTRRAFVDRLTTMWGRWPVDARVMDAAGVAAAPTIDAVEAGEGGQATDRLGRLAPDLRAGLDLAAGLDVVEQLVEVLGAQVLVVQLVDLHHRRVAAGAQALDLQPAEHPVVAHLAHGADTPLQHGFDIVRSGQHAGRRAAQLDEVAADRLEVEHRVEGRDLQHPDVGHAEHARDVLDRRLRQPEVVLLLRAPKQRQDRRRLPSLRVLGDLRLAPRLVLGGEGEGRRLDGGEATDGHQRSTSPNTMSIEPRMAPTSDNSDLRLRKSIACR